MISSLSNKKKATVPWNLFFHLKFEETLIGSYFPAQWNFHWVKVLCFTLKHSACGFPERKYDACLKNANFWNLSLRTYFQVTDCKTGEGHRWGIQLLWASFCSGLKTARIIFQKKRLIFSLQTLFMMFGECLCMVAYLILKYVVYKDTPEVINIFV